MSFPEPDEPEPLDPLDAMSAAAHIIASFAVAFAAIVYDLSVLGVV